MKTIIVSLLLSISLPVLADHKVEFNQLPEPVQKAISEQKDVDVKAIKIEKQTKDGQTVYEVDFAKPGANPKLCFAEDGTIISKDTKTVSDYVPRFPRIQTLQVKDVPQPVQSAIEQQASGRKVVDIDKETWNGKTVFEVEFAQTGRNAQVHFAEDGTVVKETRKGVARNWFMGTQVEDTPAAVQATIKREAQGQKIVDIDKEMRRGQVAYEVEIEQPGKNIELHIDENGAILRDSRKEDPSLTPTGKETPEREPQSLPN